jgi:hypothetical protein
MPPMPHLANRHRWQGFTIFFRQSPAGSAGPAKDPPPSASGVRSLRVVAAVCAIPARLILHTASSTGKTSLDSPPVCDRYRRFFSPLSYCFRAPMICSSVCRLFGMLNLLVPFPRTSTAYDTPVPIGTAFGFWVRSKLELQTHPLSTAPGPSETFPLRGKGAPGMAHFRLS